MVWEPLDIFLFISDGLEFFSIFLYIYFFHSLLLCPHLPHSRYVSQLLTLQPCTNIYFLSHGLLHLNHSLPHLFIYFLIKKTMSLYKKPFMKPVMWYHIISYTIYTNYTVLTTLYEKLGMWISFGKICS